MTHPFSCESPGCVALRSLSGLCELHYWKREAERVHTELDAATTRGRELQALADEEDWLAESPKRCAVCGHRDCFHVFLDYDADEERTPMVCAVGECTCDGERLVAPPVPGTYGEIALASGETKAISIADLFSGAAPDRVPGHESETVFARQPLSLTRETVLSLTQRAATPPPTMAPPIDVAVEKEGK